MSAGKRPPVGFVDRLDNEAEAPQLENVVRPTRAGMIDRRAAGGASVDKIEFIKAGKVRRAKLYYMKGRQGKSARIKEKLSQITPA